MSVSAKTWMAIIGVAAPVLSVVVVALISRDTAQSVARLQLDSTSRVAALDMEAKASAANIEAARLRDQQEARREQFLAAHLPKILSSNEAERRVGNALLRAVYPSEAADILRQVRGAASDGMNPALAAEQKEAETLQSATGDWTVVISADKTSDLAKRWATGAARLGSVSVYFRKGFYSVGVGAYPNRGLAEQAAVTLRPQTRPDAYVVALGNWCRTQTPRQEGDLAVIDCKTGM